jgi:hypothetical protein
VVAGESSRVIRAPGRLVVNPTASFATGTFPFSGTEIGKASQCMLMPIDSSFRVEYEATGETGEILEGGNRYVFACFLRGWDDDAVEQLFAQGHSDGATSQHAVLSIPGTRVAGTSALARGVRLAYVPDDTLHVNTVLLYRAVPVWTDGAQIALQRGSELGMPLTFECVRDATNRIAQIARLHDVTNP